MPLHIDLRPRTFDEVIGNEATIKALKQTISKSTRPHCYMFSGASGCGKSTLVKICAEELGATDINIHELNIGDARGIDSARDIIQLMSNYPLGGDAIVIQLEEIHNSTRAFQEALLLPFENVPEHVYIFMSTTEPSKVIPTLRRRFVEFKLQKIDSDTMLMYLLKIVKDKNMQVSVDVLESIIEQAEGSIGKALVLLEKIMELPVNEQLAVIDSTKIANKTIIDLCQAFLYGKSWGSVIKILEQLDENPEGYRRIIQNYMMKVLLNPKSSKNHLTASRIIINFSTYIETRAEFVATCYACLQ